MNVKVILVLTSFVFFIILGCKPDVKTSTDDLTQSSGPINTLNDNNKVLQKSGAADISDTYNLNQTQIVQDGNVGFHFKSENAMRIYLDMPGEQNVNFESDEVFSIIAQKTLKETSFKVEEIDLSGERPVIKIVSSVSTNTVKEYRPNIVVSVPKDKINGYPLITLDGVEIPIYTLE
jgi:hypothetical protein